MLAGGAYPAMIALGMLKAAPAHAFNLEGSGAGKKVIILGAGLSGMTTAYELSKLGYNCIILEARERAGGRCWSIRKNSINTEIGSPKQVASFDDGLYFNAGPSRIPHHHLLTLHYCKELGVPLEVYNNINDAAYYYAEGNGPLSNRKVRIREVQNDVRGYMSEMLVKAIDHGQLDTALSKEDTEKIIEYLRAEGGLDIDKLYKASDRRGFSESPGAGNRPGKVAEAYKLADMIQSGLMDPDFYNVSQYVYELQMTMFQAVGGMDNIAKAMQKKVEPMIRFGAEVTQIQNQPEGVKITCKDAAGSKELSADLCVCTIPLPVLSNIDNNFSADVSRAIDYATYIKTGKIGLQFKRRFWEEDEMIYGGITHTNNELTQLFYPNNDYLGKKGILLGYYNFNEKANLVGELSAADREKLALKKGALIHPQYPQEFEKSFSVSWHKVKYNQGGWAVYTSDQRKTVYEPLLTPEKNVYFAGEHLTYLNAWMAGAFESARSTVTAIHARTTDQRITYPTSNSKS